MSDRVVRVELIGDEFTPLDENPYSWIVTPEPGKRLMGEMLGPATILLHDGDKVGPFERWMVEWLRDKGPFNLEWNTYYMIAAALGSLWMEGDDNG